MTKTAHQRKYYPALDGLRGVAILLVVLLHNFGFLHYFFFGWLGVDLFFVLSGFLITDVLLDTLQSSHFLRNFYMRRILRIFPIYYLTILICLFIVPQVFSPTQEVSYYKENIIWFLFFLQNWLYIFKSHYGSPILLHFWSLAVEEQFYIVWPLVILFVKNLKVLLWIILSFLIIVMTGRYLLWVFHIENLAYDSLYTFTRIDGICIGCLLAIMFRVYPDFLKKYTSIIVFALAGLNFLMYFFNKKSAVRLPYLAFVGYTTFAMMFGFLVYEAFLERSGIVRLFFNNRVLKFFGRISYGLYVFHSPVYLISFPSLEHRINEMGSSVDTARIIAGIVATAIAVLVSLISYQYFERKLLSLKRYFV